MYLVKNQVVKSEYFLYKFLIVDFSIEPKKFFDIVFEILEKEKCYLIDFLPKKVQDNEKYYYLEKYFCKKYSKRYLRRRVADDMFADNISKIVLSLISYYKVIVFYETQKKFSFYDKLYNNNLYYKIHKLIKQIISKDCRKMYFVLENNENFFIIAIEGGYNVSVYSAKETDLEFIKLLVNKNGLFLRKGYNF